MCFRFHYPQGKPCNQTQLEVTLESVRQVFQTFPNQQVTRDKFSAITKVIQVLYLKEFLDIRIKFLEY